MNPATLFASLFVDELTRTPLSGVAVCPGSRSTPLAVAFSRQNRVPVYVHLDERSAAFFALGLALESGQPAAVVTTSGTAVANLHPAVIEADRAGVPLLLLTADRPPELRDSGANQTADQVKFYGSAVRWYLELPLPEQHPSTRTLRQIRAVADRAAAVASGLYGKPGPVHLNFPFRKPLEPSADDLAALQHILQATSAIRNKAPLPSHKPHPFTTITSSPAIPTHNQITALADLIRAHPRGLIIAGPKAATNQATAAQLYALTQITGYPLLADALSGVRFANFSPFSPGYGGHPPPSLSQGAKEEGNEVLATYPHFLAAGLPQAAPPEVVLRFGAAPTSNALLAYLENLPLETEIIAITPHATWPAPRFRLTQWLIADTNATLSALLETLAQQPPQPDHAWQHAWMQAERLTRNLIREVPLTEGPLAAHVVSALPAQARLVVGNSLPVRHLDEYALPTATFLRIFANRGVSGIDGVVSTAAGVAAASGQPTVLLLGDLSLLHDLGGLLAVSRFNLQNFDVVVFHNNGGGIFYRLPIAEHEPPFNAMFRTPHGLNFAPAAKMYGLRYQHTTPQNLHQTLRTALAQSTPHLIEVPTDAKAHEDARRALIEKIRKAQ